jgi:basic amino acid/polyamine antiporter, APA family
MSKGVFRTKSIESILKNNDESAHGADGLKRVLTLKDLTFFGIAAILGAGSFSSLGGAVFNGGPGVILLFIITAIACAFTAYCYSEFASRIPVAGSAYTYAYASFGELFAWIIGWALIMEYSIGNIYVAYSWSDYFTSLMSKCGINIPAFLSTSYMEAKHAIADGATKGDSFEAWNNAPIFAGLRFIVDVPAFIINVLITYLVFRGIKESKNFSNVMVILKMIVVALVIFVGGYLVFSNGLTPNWVPTNDAGTTSFLPNGFSGVMMAVSCVFFAYIGFDAVSVLAEESKNPQRDLPKGMILSLVICTVVYILLTLVLTGAVDYRGFEGVGDPLAFIFEPQNLNIGWMQFLVAICAVIAMTSVLLVFQMGQPRIWMSMSRDGLLPNAFQKIHPKFKTPSFSTLVTGLVVGIPILFTDKTFVLDFTSIATLFAFVLVCGGVLLIPKREKEAGKFNIPFLNAKYIYPLLIAGAIAFTLFQFPNYFSNLTKFSLLPDTQMEATKSFCSDKTSEFRGEYMIGNSEKLYLQKVLKGKPEAAVAKSITENNDKINMVVHNKAFEIYNTTITKNIIDSVFSYEPNSINISKILDTINITKIINISSVIAALDSKKDSSLIAKLNKQDTIVRAYTSAANDANKKNYVQIWQNAINNAYSNNNIEDLKGSFAKKLETQKIFNFSSIIFWLVCIALNILCLFKNWSLIPILGLTSCLYLLTGMSMNNWFWFLGWLGLGLVVYFLFGYKNSKLATKN